MNNIKVFQQLSLASLLILGVSVSAADVKPTVVLDTNYTYNFNGPGISTDLVTSPQNALRYNDRGHNQFEVNQAAIGVKKTDAPVKYEAAIWAGTLADLAGKDGGTGTPNRVYSLIKVANVTYGEEGAWSLTGGKFTFSSMGYENGDSHKNWNYGRSWGYQMMPKRTLGLKFIYPVSDMLRAEVVVSNGADRHLSNNLGKLIGLNFVYGEEKSTMANIGATYSPERSLRTGGQRLTVALNAKHMFDETMGAGFAGNMAQGRYDGTDAAGNAVPGLRWSTAFYGMKSFMADHQSALRIEYARDGQGAFVGNAMKNDLLGVTLTHKYMATANLAFWGEMRWDGGNRRFWSTSDTAVTKASLWTATLAATFTM